jgi:hypothetical protein
VLLKKQAKLNSNEPDTVFMRIPTRFERPGREIWEIVKMGVNVGTLIGFVIALTQLWTFFHTTPRFEVRSTGEWIQGVSFQWIFGSLVLISMRSTLTALESLARWFGD